MCMRQLEYRDKDLEEVVHYLQRMRQKEKEQQDEKYGIRQEELAMGSIVLLNNTRCKKNMLQKLAFNWLGSYKIYHTVERKRTYMLKELDGLRLASTFADDCLKKFYLQQRLRLNHTPNLDHEMVPNLENFLAVDDNDLSNMPNNFADN